MKNLLTIIHKPKIIIPVVAVIAIVFGVYGYRKINALPAYQYAVVSTGTVSGDLSLSGAVKIAKNIELSFPKSGRVASVNVHTGQTVSQGTVLASLQSQDSLGALNQAKGVYEAAQANYQKIINGATSPDIEVAKAAVAAAQSNLDGVKSQQDTAVTNAHRTLLNSSLVALPMEGDNSTVVAPIISGAYTGDEGQYIIQPYNGSGQYFSLSGLENGGGQIGLAAPQPLGTHGLYIQFPQNFLVDRSKQWVVNIPNTESPSYVANYNAYEAALTARDQMVANAQAQLDQAKANLNLKQAAARPEDVQAAQAQVDSTQGMYQAAAGAYQNNLITAPISGTITLVDVNAGENATQNKTVIGLASSGQFQIDTYVSADDLSKVTLGTAAQVSFDAYSNVPFTAHVVDVESGSSISDSRAQYKVTFEMDSNDARIQAGIPAHILIAGGQKTNILSIPRTALITQNGIHSVIVRHGNTVTPTVIQTGLIGSENVEVVSGLNAGDMVVVVGNSIVN